MFNESCILLCMTWFKLVFLVVVIGIGGLFGVEGLIIVIGGVLGLLIG